MIQGATQSTTPVGGAGLCQEVPAASVRNIGTKAIRRGLLANLTGTVVPAVVAVFSIRAIVGAMGNARFGLLALSWTFINSVGIFDLRIGRALTRFLAVHELRDNDREAAVVWSSLAVMQLWLGPEFAAHSVRAGRILAVSTFVNCMAWLPFLLVQGAGRGDWAGKLHAIEPIVVAFTAVLIFAWRILLDAGARQALSSQAMAAWARARGTAP